MLEILAAQLFAKPMPSFTGVDWECLMKEAEQQTVYKLIYHAVGSQIPATMEPKCKSLYFANMADGIRNSHQHEALHRILTENGIPYVIIKGMASASYYPVPFARCMGDVDFLIRQEDFSRTTDLLVNAGYVTKGKGSIKHLTFYKDGDTLEMHREPGGLPDGEKGDLCRAYLSDIIETETEYATQHGVCCIPDAFHHGLVMLLHTASHMINSGIGLRHLCDWAVFADRLSNETFRNLFEEKLRAVGLWRFAQLLTQVSIKYLGCAEKQWAQEDVDDALLEAIIGDIFDSGNFGRKDFERINEAKLMTTDRTATIDDSRFVLLKALTEKAYAIMPTCKRVKILLPVGWICVGVKHLIRIRNHKRPKLHVKKMISGAKERKTIYLQFRLFE